MPVIVFASPKGGVGKTTSAMLLAQELAHERATVSLLDADPNEPMVRWASIAEAPHWLSVHGGITEDTIIKRIDEESALSQIVIFELEGSKNLKMSRALGRADLVIIPLKPSHLDAVGAADAIRLIRAEEESFRREIPHAVLFTMTNGAIMTRDHTANKSELTEAGVEVFETSLTARTAFGSIFTYSSMLRDLPSKSVSNVGKAVVNAEDYAAEVVHRLRDILQKKETAA